MPLVTDPVFAGVDEPSLRSGLDLIQNAVLPVPWFYWGYLNLRKIKIKKYMIGQ